MIIGDKFRRRTAALAVAHRETTAPTGIPLLHWENNHMPTKKTKSVLPSIEEMEKRIARFDRLEPTKKGFTPVAAKAYELLAAKDVFLLLAPPDHPRKAAKQAIDGLPGIEAGFVRCPPQTGPGLHNHQRTYETFICLDGEFDVMWGENATYAVKLKPYDAISIPPNVFRAFKNVSDKDAHMFAIIQGDAKDIMVDIVYLPTTRDEVVSKLGPEGEKALNGIGITFGSDSGD